MRGFLVVSISTATEALTTKILATTQPAINAKQSPVDIHEQNLVIAQHPSLDWRGSRGRDRYADRDQVASIDSSSNTEPGNHWRTVQENTRNYAGKLVI